MYRTTTLEKITEDIRYGYTASAESAGSHRFVRITDITDNGLLKPYGAMYATPDSASAAKFAVEEGVFSWRAQVR